MFGGFAGSFFAVRQGFISPESFNFLESATILAIVVLGGMGSQVGVAIAAIAMVGGPSCSAISGSSRPCSARASTRTSTASCSSAGDGRHDDLAPAWAHLRPAASVVFRERKSISGSLVKEGHG
jgi:branched-chain amino acid transport system permease protein